jgi:chaperonin GroEL (HSP60 family)
MDDLGLASTVEAVQFGEHHCTLVRADTAKTVTVCLRGATSHGSAEVERAFDDALGVTSLASTGPIVAGGGAVHAHLARGLRETALEIGDRVGMALDAYASALESIPRTLAENAGVDPVDALIALFMESQRWEEAFHLAQQHPEYQRERILGRIKWEGCRWWRRWTRKRPCSWTGWS